MSKYKLDFHQNVQYNNFFYMTYHNIDNSAETRFCSNSFTCQINLNSDHNNRNIFLFDKFFKI